MKSSINLFSKNSRRFPKPLRPVESFFKPTKPADANSGKDLDMDIDLSNPFSLLETKLSRRARDRLPQFENDNRSPSRRRKDNSLTEEFNRRLRQVKFKSAYDHLFPPKTSSNKFWPSPTAIYFRKPTYVNDHIDKLLVDNDDKVLSLDVLWKATRRKYQQQYPIGCLTLSSSKFIMIFQLKTMGKGKFPDALKRILEDESILKIGINVDKDLDKIKDESHIKVVNTLDIMSHYKDLFKKRINLPNIKYIKETSKHNIGHTADHVKLSQLIRHLFGLSNLKRKVATSNWQRQLTQPQVKCMF